MRTITPADTRSAVGMNLIEVTDSGGLTGENAKQTAANHAALRIHSWGEGGMGPLRRPTDWTAFTPPTAQGPELTRGRSWVVWTNPGQSITRHFTALGADGVGLESLVSAGGGLLSADRAGNFIDGGAGTDYVAAGHGADTVLGGADADQIWGLGGNDVLLGEAGNDLIAGDGTRYDDSMLATPEDWTDHDVLGGTTTPRFGGSGWPTRVGFTTTGFARTTASANEAPWRRAA